MKFEFNETDIAEFVKYIADCLDCWKNPRRSMELDQIKEILYHTQYIKIEPPKSDEIKPVELIARICCICHRSWDVPRKKGKFICPQCKAEGKHSTYKEVKAE